MSAFRTAVIKEASEAWKLLHGIVCIYKPKNISLRSISQTIRQKLSEDLNSMSPPPRQEVVNFRRLLANESSSPKPGEQLITEINDGNGKIEIVKSLSYSDHPLVAGPGYRYKDIKMAFSYGLGRDCSGIVVSGVNDGCRTSNLISLNNWLKSYIVSGEFGKATDTFFHTGRILEKATYHNIRKHMIDHMLASTQASHQRLAFVTAGVPLDSDRAYELASEGLVRPEAYSAAIIYSMKCLKFNPPHFDLELHCVNESEAYLKHFIHELGLRLNSAAVCTKIRCTKVGPFDTDMALLDKHWTLENFISNMTQTSKLLQNFDLKERNPMISETSV